MKRYDYHLLVWLLLLITPLSGCSILYTDINIKDRLAFSPNLRGSYNLRSPEEAARPLAIDVEISRVNGNSTRSLASSEHIKHGNVLINGPALLNNSSSTINAMLGVRAGWILKERFSIEMIGGLDILRSDIDVQSGNLSASDTLNDTGPFFGFKLGYKPVEKVMLYGKGIQSTNFDYYGYSLASGELAAAVKLVRNLTLSAGWHWLNVYYRRQYESNVIVEASGPMVGLELSF